jgi:hypothetical protein
MMEIRNNLFKANNYIANNSKANNSKADNTEADNTKADNYRANNREDDYVRKMLVREYAAEGVFHGVMGGTIYGLMRPLDENPFISVAKGAALGAIAGGTIGGIIGAVDYYLSRGYYRDKV